VVKNKKVGCKFAISFILLIFAAKLVKEMPMKNV